MLLYIATSSKHKILLSKKIVWLHLYTARKHTLCLLIFDTNNGVGIYKSNLKYMCLCNHMYANTPYALVLMAMLLFQI